MQVQKMPRETHAFIMATSPEHREKIIKSQVSIDGKHLTSTSTIPIGLIEQERARRNCLVLIVRNINRSKSITEVEATLQDLIGTNNIASIYFPYQEEQLHGGVANVEVTTPATYKQFVT